MTSFSLNWGSAAVWPWGGGKGLHSLKNILGEPQSSHPISATVSFTLSMVSANCPINNVIWIFIYFQHSSNTSFFLLLFWHSKIFVVQFMSLCWGILVSIYDCEPYTMWSGSQRRSMLGWELLHFQFVISLIPGLSTRLGRIPRNSEAKGLHISILRVNPVVNHTYHHPHGCLYIQRIQDRPMRLHCNNLHPFCLGEKDPLAFFWYSWTFQEIEQTEPQEKKGHGCSNYGDKGISGVWIEHFKCENVKNLWEWKRNAVYRTHRRDMCVRFASSPAKVQYETLESVKRALNCYYSRNCSYIRQCPFHERKKVWEYRTSTNDVDACLDFGLGFVFEKSQNHCWDTYFS